MSNKTAAQLLRKLDTYFSNASNNNKLLKVNASGAFEGVDPSSLVSGGGSTSVLSASSLNTLPVTGVQPNTLGIVPNGSGYLLYVWSGTTSTGTTSLWKNITGSTSSFVNSLGFTYAGSTTPPVDASVSNSFEGLEVSGTAVELSDGIELNQGTSNIHQITGTVSTALPSGLQMSTVVEIDLTNVDNDDDFRIHFLFADGVSTDYVESASIPLGTLILCNFSNGTYLGVTTSTGSGYNTTVSVPRTLIRIEYSTHLVNTLDKKINIYRVSDGAEIYKRDLNNGSSLMFYNSLNSNPRFAIHSVLTTEADIKVKRVVIDRNF